MKRITPTAALTALLFIFLLGAFSCRKSVMGDAKTYFLSGERYYKQMMYEEAMVEYKKAIEEKPSFAPAHLGMGKCLYSLGRFDEAIKEYKKAMDLDPKNGEIMAEVALVYIERGLDEEGLMMLEKARDLDPDNVKVYMYMGAYHIKEKEYAKAIEDFLAAARKDKKSVEPLIRLSLLYSQAENPSYINGNLAEKYALKAMELSPENPMVLDALAAAHFAKGEYDLALAKEKEALKLSPENTLLKEHLAKYELTVKGTAEEHNIEGARLLEEGNYSAAAEEFKMAVTLDPTFSDGYYNLGKVYSQLGNYPEAEANYQKAIELSPDDARYHYNLAIVYSRTNELEKSEQEYLYALNIDPYYDKAYNNLGVLYVKMEKYEEALTQFKKAFDIKPKSNYKVNIDMVKKKLGSDVETPESPAPMDSDIEQF
ncbi:MAG: tetratricopeptide repeat protein [Deltaproteobacteria bacterium]|uniref:Tetratricopeptide repeat protein n=1 Tax=Candidatus Zymogenus saltonus TaxID=2844893 RepID=A0A9D8KEG1_9DELT|nr:tetratricopeptide repeat protein [Candidatus Zymogenus saltonus]